jgi:K+-sensing histidine kinase KdpD
MKIDITQIPNFDALPDEAKSAILAMEFADAPDMSQFVAKSVFDKKASEAADLSKQLKSRMTQDEQAEAQRAEALATMQAELEALRSEKAISEYTAQFLGIGYDEKLAKSTAAALHKGDMATMFKNHATFVAEREKAMKAELLKSTPTPPAGDGDKGPTKEDFQKMTLAEKQKFATENPDAYNQIYGGN